MTLKTEVISRSAIESFLSEYEEIRSDYSGRGMYGKTCFGIVTDNLPRTLMEIAAGIVDYSDADSGEGVDLVLDLAGVVCVDSMGLSSIVYFPGFDLI